MIRYNEAIARTAVLEIGAIVIRASSSDDGRWYAFAHYADGRVCDPIRTVADGNGATAEEAIGATIAGLSKLHVEIERAIRLAANPEPPELLTSRAGR